MQRVNGVGGGTGSDLGDCADTFDELVNARKDRTCHAGICRHQGTAVCEECDVKAAESV